MAKRKALKAIPRFASEAQEREFWETHDTTPYVDWSRATLAVFPNLKPSTTTISLRLPAFLLADLKVLANRQDVPYQSLLKVFLTERVAAGAGESTRRVANKRMRRPKTRPTPRTALTRKK